MKIKIFPAPLEEGGNGGGGLAPHTVNHVVVVEPQGGSLKVVGKSEPLAEGDRIFSARFVGDKGYVVTFREVDPLYTFDLSTPTQPRKLGELKIPGFSTYIHLLDEHHLLTIGTGMSVNRSVQLSLFDVSDMANPIQKFTHNLVAPYATSEAQVEHKAFNYFPEKKVLAVPYSDWNARPPSDTSGKSSFVSELRVLSVDTQPGFAPKGAMSMADLSNPDESPNGSVRHSPIVRRSILADDFVYAITDAGIRVAPLSNLSAPLATVSFDAPN